MKTKELKILADKTKYLIEIKEGANYLFVFDRSTGLNQKSIKQTLQYFEETFNTKSMAILIDDIAGMRVLSMEENNANL